MSAVSRRSVEANPDECLRIHVSFVTDRCVASRVDAREQPEWPPHPGRFYMALAAAHFETDGTEEEKRAERDALEWLASLPAPRIVASEVAERTPVVCYVPVNDAVQPIQAMLQSAPGMPRSRQPRRFPTVILDRTTDQNGETPDVTYLWRDAAGLSQHVSALERLCREVIRVGHSSSLVMAWLEAGSDDCFGHCWEPVGNAAELACRIAVEGELDRLQSACRADQIELFAQLKAEIDSTKGKAQAAAKKRFQDVFGERYKASVRPPEPTPATLGVWQGYRKAAIPGAANTEVHINSYFERDLLILAKVDGPTLNVERTLGLTGALRAALKSVHEESRFPAWLCGHDPDGSPTSSPHVAFLALPFAGFEHADGHVMGLALAIPRGIPLAERGKWLGPLLVDQTTGDTARPELTLWGRDLPDWTLQLEERPSPPRMLRNETWTKPSSTWASVTPVVLDLFPKASRTDERQAWNDEVIEIIQQACLQAGLPMPSEVCVGSTAWQLGVPRAWVKTRHLRGKANVHRTAQLGDGFPFLPTKSSRPAKPQVHVRLHFDEPVAGPVLIGAGRFAGYGLCLPYESR
ncbi:MAG: type I-U CRISPR-associated protein Cas5/Cas6 [Planctomycetaceae bacterium]|nr:type I-U CRISPR-associated protein Cas5/Cas6 [Planctomycetaceae bacterium]